MKPLLAVFLLALLPTASFAGFFMHEPTSENVEVEVLLDAIRSPYERKLQQPVVFKVSHAGVKNEWGFVRGVLRRPEGGWIDYANTQFRPGFEEGNIDDGFCALLKFNRGRWTVIAYSIGTKEVPWFTWADYYHAPPRIFK